MQNTRSPKTAIISRTSLCLGLGAIVACAPNVKTQDELPESAQGTNLTYDGINFGDNLGEWSLDQECDDPRFEGVGMSSITLAEDIGRDASDCMRLYQLNAITLK